MRSLITLLGFSFLLIGCMQQPVADVAEPPLVKQEYVSNTVGFRAISQSGIGWTVNNVEVIPEGRVPGYTLVILNVIVANEDVVGVFPSSATLVDEYSNTYANWPMSPQPNLTQIPMVIEAGQRVEGHMLFNVPVPALNQNLRLRWESDFDNVRIEIFLGNLRDSLEG